MSKCDKFKTAKGFDNPNELVGVCLCNGNLPDQWISVEDAIPQYGKAVLVYCQFQSDEQYELDIAYLELTENWISTKLGCQIDVKYWMPLPDAPEVNHE